jgi:hypothetical protein
MEDNDDISEQELSEVIEYLIELGAMEIMGYDSISDNFTYRITSKCKDIYPELYYSHYEAVGELAQSLWMQDIIDIVFTEGQTIVAVTQEQVDFIKETINTFTEDERLFLETIINHYDQK